MSTSSYFFTQGLGLWVPDATSTNGSNSGIPNIYSSNLSIGIGTSSNITSRLTVAGDIYASSNINTALTLTASNIILGGSANANISASGWAATSNAAFSALGAGSNYWLPGSTTGQIYTLCNIGVGTSNPGYGIEVPSSLGAGSLTVTGFNSSLTFNNSNGNTQIASVGVAGNYSSSAAVGDIVFRNSLLGKSIHFQNSSNAAALTVSGNNLVGVANTNPTYPLDVGGTIHSSSNIISPGGTLGRTMLLFWGYENLTANGTQTFPLYFEPGNPGGAGGSMFNQGFLIAGNDGANQMTLNHGQILLRGCTMNGSTSGSTYSASVRCYNSNASSWSTLASWNFSDTGQIGGYVTASSPYFTLTNNSYPILGISLSNTSSSANQFRLGPTYLNMTF